MVRALELARDHHPHPNPRVGSVVVDSEGNAVGEGAHIRPGEPHAEIVALGVAGSAAEGSTVYVTLEPCSHHGRTPPCVDALIAAGVKKVIVATGDPDPEVSGNGIRRLREAGIDVEVGMMADEARANDPAYFYHRETGMPLVTLKWAMTLDGSVAADDGSSQWITSRQSRDDAHRLRAESDAVVVGAGTLREDDPRLTVRLPDYSGPQPVPVVVTGAQDLSVSAQIWEREPVIVSTRDRDIPDGELVVVAGEGEFPDPGAVCEALAERGLIDLFVEGGPTLAQAWWSAGVVGRGVVYIGARVAGGSGRPPLAGDFLNIGDADVVSVKSVRTLGSDIRIDFETL